MPNDGTDCAFRIEDVSWGRGKPLLIAELGTGHEGDRHKARELVRAAIESGADCIKLQHVIADEILHPRTGQVPLPGGNVSLFERFKRLEMPVDFFAEMKELAESEGALFLCTPFGPRSARELVDIGCRMVKVASPELNHVELLDIVASSRLPAILSTGVSTLADIEFALSRFADAMPGLLHCVTAYPAPEEDYNLRLVPSLSRVLGVPVGVSDHTLDPCLIPCVATALGAFAIEKHFCLSRNDPGLDDPIALPPGDFAAMTRAVSAVGTCPDRALDDLAQEYGSERVARSMGDGRKRLGGAELANYGRTNRSLHATKDIATGERFSPRNVAALRTEKLLSPGLEPKFASMLFGRASSRDIEDGEGIEWSMVGAARPPCGESRLA